MGGQHGRRAVAARASTRTPTQQASAPPAPPTFRRVRKGWDPVEVADHLEELERERGHLRAALAESENVRGEQRDRLDRFEAIESELTRSVRLASQTGEAVMADAERRAAELLVAAQREVEALHAAGRARLAEEERSLDKLRMAVAAEAAMLKEVERQLTTRISRAAAALVEIVDRPGGWARSRRRRPRSSSSRSSSSARPRGDARPGARRGGGRRAVARVRPAGSTGDGAGLVDHVGRRGGPRAGWRRPRPAEAVSRTAGAPDGRRRRPAAAASSAASPGSTGWRSDGRPGGVKRTSVVSSDVGPAPGLSARVAGGSLG